MTAGSTYCWRRTVAVKPAGWWNSLGAGAAVLTAPTWMIIGSIGPMGETVQVDDGDCISTFTVSQWADRDRSCHLVAQVITTSG